MTYAPNISNPILVATFSDLTNISGMVGQKAVVEDTMAEYQYTKNGWINALSNSTNMSNASQSQAVSEYAAYSSDMMIYNATKNRVWVEGVEKIGAFPAVKKANTVNGTATFWLTDNNISTGFPIFSTIYPESIIVVPYGTSAIYQISNPVVSSDRKSITVNVNQVTSVLAGLVQITASANGVDCRLLVLGD